jgi:Type IV secretory pathway, VirD4 components
MKVLIDSIIEIFISIFSGLEDLIEKDHEHNAEFGKPHKLISSRHKGFCVDGKRFLDLKTSRQNMCVVAGSGKGKTQSHIFPTILNSTASMCVNDNSGELESTVPYLQSKGATTLVMNLTKNSGVYINPLDGCKGDVSTIRKIVKTLMGTASKENDFFSISGEDCLSLFIQYVVESEPRIHANLGNVYRLLLEYQGAPKTIEYLFAQKASEDVWSKFKALAGNSEKQKNPSSLQLSLPFHGWVIILYCVTSLP